MDAFASFQVLMLCLGGLFFADSAAFPRTEVEALLSFKRAIMDDPMMFLSNWNSFDSYPCRWSGVSCSLAGDHVVKLNISGAFLSGFIATELFQLSALQELILHGNLLMGTIPKEIGMLKNLKVLDLGSNRITGTLPPEIGNLSSVVKINFHSNGLTGKLPDELGKLMHLEELVLDRNKFLGTILANYGSKYSFNTREMYAANQSTLQLCGSYQLKVADFSYNFFVGTIPKCLDYLPRSSFAGNCLQEGDPKQRSAAQCGGAPSATFNQGINMTDKSVEIGPRHQSKSSKPPWLLTLEIVTGVMAGLLFVVALFTVFQKCKSKPSIVIPWKKSLIMKDDISSYADSESLKDAVRYSRLELEVACEDFSNIIGSNSDSSIYKGIMKNGQEIAVTSICMKEEQWTSYLEIFFQEVVIDLARLNHENAGKLLGYCREGNPFTRMLVFEYASNGTLYEHLHYGEGCQFSWTRRMKIIIGIAKGLKYLHTDLDPPFTISELSSSSVYLTEDFSPKLVDFERWKTVISRTEKSRRTRNEGAVYMLPNPSESYDLDIQGNIYAFGVLLLEIISGKPTYTAEKGFLLDWAKEFLDFPDIMPYVVDPELKNFKYEDLKAICEVVNLCIHPKASSRTTMQDLCSMLESCIDTSISADFKASSLAWAELALSV